MAVPSAAVPIQTARLDATISGFVDVQEAIGSLHRFADELKGTSKASPPGPPAGEPEKQSFGGFWNDLAGDLHQQASRIRDAEAGLREMLT